MGEDTRGATEAAPHWRVCAAFARSGVSEGEKEKLQIERRWRASPHLVPPQDNPHRARTGGARSVR